MASSSLKEGLILKTEATYENIDEILVEKERDNDDQAAKSKRDDVAKDETVSGSTQKLPNQTAQLLKDKVRRKRGIHLALSRINNIFLLFLLPLFIILCK